MSVFGSVLRQSWITVLASSISVVCLGQAAPGHLARLTSTAGFVRIDRGDNTAGDPGLLNMPLVEGESVVTGDDGQAEVEFEDGSLARLTPHTSMTIARLGSASGTQLALVQGLAYFELRAAPGISYTVSAGDDRVHPMENATVRVSLDEPPPAIAVLSGGVHVERPGSYATDVRAGETFRADVSGAGRYFLTEEIAPDTWDGWNETRDEQAANAAARQTDARGSYAGDKGYGWSDLDANGTWYDTGGQGQVWQPEGGDSAEFDPYGNGSWVWYPTAGYVWASAYPWGWTPFRCGSWSYWNSFGWGWAPAGNCVNFGFGYGGGYGGYGGGYGPGLVNIRLAPHGYPIHRPPSPNRPGLHPIVTVGGALPRVIVTAAPHERMINGVRAVPLRGTALGYTTRGGASIGAGLLRDYPVNRATHTAVLGVQPGQGAAGFAGQLSGESFNHQPFSQQSPMTYGNTAGSGAGYGTVRGGTGVQRGAAAPGSAGAGRPGVPVVYGRAPVPNTQPQRSTPAYSPRPSAPAAAPHPSFSAPAPAPHASAPAPAASGKK